MPLSRALAAFPAGTGRLEAENADHDEEQAGTDTPAGESHGKLWPGAGRGTARPRTLLRSATFSPTVTLGISLSQSKTRLTPHLTDDKSSMGLLPEGEIETAGSGKHPIALRRAALIARYPPNLRASSSQLTAGP